MTIDRKIRTLTIGVILLSINVFAYKNFESATQGSGKTSGNVYQTLASTCAPATAQIDLDVNNIRAKIMNGGDMWWDIFGNQLPRYEVPKGSNIHSLFASALWIGGIDDGQQLRVAAQTYRQTGNDLWPGPLDGDGNVDDATCKQYDKHFKVTLKEVQDYVAGGPLTLSIINWPGDGPNGAMAPYYDGDGSGTYNPTENTTSDPAKKDYPDYNVYGAPNCNSTLFGDQTIWWVVNDKGNIHTESSTSAIGMEIQSQAFGFTTNDEINNMTFYKHKLINRSSSTLNKAYFGQWVDADLGVCRDDYVGCDVARGLGFTYNGDAVDDNTPNPCSGELGYGPTPPAVGLDFFQGPIADFQDTVDNDRDGCVDGFDTIINGVHTCIPETQSHREQIIMSKFVYYNNDRTVRGNPDIGSDFYNYLSGFWRDGRPFTYGGDAYDEPGQVVCSFMFPGDTDPKGYGTKGIPQANQNWTEVQNNNPPDDRRFIQSAGPFTLKPGATNSITVGAVWARAASGDNLSSIISLKSADDKAQALFDNCFRVLNGPNAPDMTIQELDKELIIYLSNKPNSNNYKEQYSEKDPLIISPCSAAVFQDRYKFEGYLIYQLKDAAVSAGDLKDPTKARLIAQCDVKNGVARLINYYSSDGKLCPNIGGADAECAVEEVNGADEGIQHSFRITTDAFATGDNKLINHKQYYFKAIAYGYNNYKPYKQNVAPVPCGSPTYLVQPASDGQKRPFIAGRIGNGNYSVAIPHDPVTEAGGTKRNASYGSGPKITRIEGQGNGGRVLDLTDETISQIMSSPVSKTNELTYINGAGPIEVKIIDPLNVLEGSYEVRLVSEDGKDRITLNKNARWNILRKNTGELIESDTSIQVGSEQLFTQFGFSVSIKQVNEPGSSGDLSGDNSDKNGFLEASVSFADPDKVWLTGLPDIDGDSFLNWIRSGTNSIGSFSDYLGLDEHQNYEKILGGTWSPYRLCGVSQPNQTPPVEAQPAVNSGQVVINSNLLRNLASVDVVITADKSKWTRCPVLEEQDDPLLAHPFGGNTLKLNLRKSPSVDKNGVPGDSVTVSSDPNHPGYIAAYGMGWFPGYVINIETGERLNMAFGEDSWNPTDNGRDMMWNPTSRVVSNPGRYPVIGGRHYIYVFGHNGDERWPPSDVLLPNGLKDVPRYDAGKTLWQLLNAAEKTSGSPQQKKKEALSDAIWVNLPLLVPGHKLLETDVKVRLRVGKPYKRAYSGNWGLISNAATADTPLDTSTSPINNNYPIYSFGMSDVATKKGETELAKTALDLINIVPNPYYGYSAYEGNTFAQQRYTSVQVDNRVRITNLPETCVISIYAVNGTLIRKIKKSEPTTFVDWDLRNQANVPIASGLYIIHIEAPGLGEKTLKWFGIMRPVDLDSY